MEGYKKARPDGSVYEAQAEAKIPAPGSCWSMPLDQRNFDQNKTRNVVYPVRLAECDCLAEECNFSDMLDWVFSNEQSMYL